MESSRQFQRRAQSGDSPPPLLCRYVHQTSRDPHPSQQSFGVPDVVPILPIASSNKVKYRAKGKNKSRSRSTSTPFLTTHSKHCCQLSQKSYSSLRDVGLSLNVAAPNTGDENYRRKRDTKSKTVKVAILFGCFVLMLYAFK